MNKLRTLLDNNKIDALFVSMPSNIRYTSGYLADYCYVLITRESQYYFTDGRFIIEAHRDLSSDWQVVDITPANAQDIIYRVLADSKIKRIGYDSEIMHSDYLFVESLLAPYDSVDMTSEILAVRAVKCASEIDEIVGAQRIAERALETLKSDFRLGVSERELAARLDYLMRVGGADGNSFDTIVAFGENSAVAHAKPGDRQLKSGDIILIDFGCKVGGYCSDMTRTFIFGEASEQVKDMYDSVLRANELAISVAHSGMTCRELDKVARDYLASRGYGEYFIHSLGHGVGIDIHESPSLNRRSETELCDDMVVTIEPGVYIEGVGGIRIEDMIVVKGDKAQNLTTSNKKFEIINI